MLTIIIDHYQTPHLLKLCLKTLLKNRPQNMETQIIVTDSETTGETSCLMKNEFPGIEFLASKENIGFGKSVNRALKIARGDFILILNADIIVHKPETIEKMVDFLKQNPAAGLIGPQLLNINGSFQPSAFKFYTPLVILVRRTFLKKTRWGKKIMEDFIVKADKPAETDWLMGSVLMTTRPALEKVGILDEQFFMYFEDVDWARRFWQNGYKVIYYPEAKIYHYHMQASKKSGGLFDFFISKYTRIHVASAIKYFKKYGLKTAR